MHKKPMKISLSPEVERLIEEKLKSGRFATADDVVRESLELLDHREKQTGRSSSNDDGILAIVERATVGLTDKDWDDVPADLSKNVDHYLYGKPKVE
jgi:antitoxin ParD1/3/4